MQILPNEDINKFFKKFGFNYQYESNELLGECYSWYHDGETHASKIEIQPKMNALYLTQYNKKTEQIEPFGVMAPVWEIISLARDHYLISMKKREENHFWDIEASVKAIIKGTMGDKND